MVERITGKPFVQPPEDYEGMDVQVKIRTKEADEQASNDLAFMLQTIGNSLDPSFTQLILAEIADLKSMPEIAEKIKQFQPAPPSPEEQQMNQLQIQLLEAQIANEQAKASENSANGEFDMARAQNEMAKAQTEVSKSRKLEAEADMIDLEYVEEDTGTNHERELDLMQTQARGNIALKTLEANLKVENEPSKPAPKK
jgi:hypothetical protein